MDPKRHDADRGPLPDGDDLQSVQARRLRDRQQAASYLRAARLTDDAAERESLRRKAAELLSPRRGGEASPTRSTSDAKPRG
jgi:hypothetical protein